MAGKLQAHGFSRPIAIDGSRDGSIAVICENGSGNKLRVFSSAGKKEIPSIFDSRLRQADDLLFDDAGNLVLFCSTISTLYMLGPDLVVLDSIELPEGEYGGVRKSEHSFKILVSKIDSQKIIQVCLKTKLISDLYSYQAIGQQVFCERFFVKKNSLYLLDKLNAHCYVASISDEEPPTRFLSYGRGGMGKCRNPSDILVTSGSLVIVDFHNYVIQFFNEDLSFSHQIGGKGDELGCFDLPLRCCISSNSFIVCDKNNDRIVRIDRDTFELEELIVPYFRGGSVRRPSGIAIDENRRVLVADRGNGSVQVFDDSLNFIGFLGGRSQKFDRPSSIETYQVGSVTRYIVAQRRKGSDCRIQVFQSENGYQEIGLIKEYPAGMFNDPQDIAVSDDGILYIADTLNRRIVGHNIDNDSYSEIDLAAVSGNPRILIKTVCIAPNGNVYTADFDRGTVFEFDHNLAFSRSLELFTDFSENLKVLRSIFVGESFLFVCGRGPNQIQAFSLSGDFMNNISADSEIERNWNHPVKIASKGNGLYLVADKENDRIVEFSYAS